MDEQLKDPQENILDKINSGEVKMRSKYYFMFQGIAVIVGTVLLFALSIFFTSFIFYMLGVNGLTISSIFGRKGLLLFLIIVPWIPLIVALAITILLSWILRSYSFGYRNPLLYMPVAVIAVIIACSLLLHLASFHQNFSRYASQRRIPVVQGFYRDYRMPATPKNNPLNYNFPFNEIKTVPQM